MYVAPIAAVCGRTQKAVSICTALCRLAQTKVPSPHRENGFAL